MKQAPKNFNEYWNGPRCETRDIWDAKTEEEKHLRTYLEGLCRGIDDSESVCGSLEIALKALERCKNLVPNNLMCLDDYAHTFVPQALDEIKTRGDYCLEEK